MTKNVWSIVGGVIVVGLLLWFFSTLGSASPSAGTATSTSPSASTSSIEAGVIPAKPKTATTVGMKDSNSYKSLLTQTGSYECDYAQVSESGQSNNVIYIYGGKMRAEFRSMSGGITTANLMVYDGRYTYQWREGATTGTKAPLTSLSQLPFAIPQDLTSGAIYGNSYESVGWKCHPWLTNKTLLVPPSYVTFR